MVSEQFETKGQVAPDRTDQRIWNLWKISSIVDIRTSFPQVQCVRLQKGLSNEYLPMCFAYGHVQLEFVKHP